MLDVLFNIWQFIRYLYSLLHTVWVLVVNGIRFVFRAVSASFLFLSNFPQELAVVLTIALIIGLCLFVLGRN